jgi:putative hemolysin
MDQLISTNDFAKALRMSPVNPLVPILKSISGIDRMNKLYHEVKDLEGLQCINAIFQTLNIDTITKGDLDQVPVSGGCVIVCNHPYGGLDGLAILRVLQERRSDTRVLANFLLKEVKPLSSLFIPVNPLDSKVASKSSTSGLKEALTHVKQGGCLVIFPAGEVSTFQKGETGVQDARWNPSAMKLIMKLNVAVIPVYFEGGNSQFFHLLGKINANLRTLRLPAELMNKENRKIALRIGNAISNSDIELLGDVQLVSRFLRAKVYALASDMDVPKRYFRGIRRKRKVEEISTGPSTEVLANEVLQLNNYLLIEQSHFQVFCVPANLIPNLLIEIGRLREMAFRAVGEGSNKALDLDEFDLHYQHLILWDKEKQAVAGAYRIGNGAEIIYRFGKKGFYTNTLFRFKQRMLPVLGQSIELGRSFVSNDYQKQRWPLYLLWQGILKYIESSPNIYYVIGPVSMSHAYSTVSKELIVSYVMKHFSVENPNDFVRARNPFKMKSKKVDKEALLYFAGKEMNRMDKLIAEIDPNKLQVPVLFKKYLAQNACIYAFNVDKSFNNAVDAFMLLDISMLAESELLQRRH